MDRLHGVWVDAFRLQGRTNQKYQARWGTVGLDAGEA